MKRILLAIGLSLMLTACGGALSTELQKSTEGSGSDALRKSPCACTYEKLEIDVLEWQS